ncbi:hypothetical protein SR187_7320 [Streptococcus ruminantium]|uniref:Uncharacterized protein n=1 Tax=Streptococcus ruminantium TaxID=1917441 RepID=A0A2Z5TPP1_9STRE|nr:hypothetical protein SR187_7320 [Streptococcus ruminantium]
MKLENKEIKFPQSSDMIKDKMKGYASLATPSICSLLYQNLREIQEYFLTRNYFQEISIL